MTQRRDQAHGTGGHRDARQRKQTQGLPELSKPWLDEASKGGRSSRGRRGSDKLDLEQCPHTRWIFSSLLKVQRNEVTCMKSELVRGRQRLTYSTRPRVCSLTQQSKHACETEYTEHMFLLEHRSACFWLLPAPAFASAHHLSSLHTPARPSASP